MNNEIISLDLETSGVDIEKGVTILSIGMVHLATGAEFYREAKHDLLVVEPRASRVHQLDMNSLDIGEKETLASIDLLARLWLGDVTKVEKQHRLISLGWNVAGFDMPFVRKFLPKTASQFSYRSIDLNAVLFAEDVVRGRALLETKRMYKKLFPNANAHNALADAKAAAHVFEQYTLTQQLQPLLSSAQEAAELFEGATI